jgi:micrococcal nuclease
MRVIPAIGLACLAAVVVVEPAGQPHAPDGEHCTVARVVDGDTFYCAGDLKVRLIGIDSPERGQGRFYTDARTALMDLLPAGTAVVLERDVDLADRYGRRLAYVWRDEAMVNETMVRAGWAVSYSVPPNIKYVDRFVTAQRAARQEGSGLWAQDGFACEPSAFRRGECEGE